MTTKIVQHYNINYEKIFSILALAIAFTTSIFAQGDNKNQLTISAGLGYQGIVNLGVHYSF